MKAICCPKLMGSSAQDPPELAMQPQLSKSTLGDSPVRISWKPLPLLTDIGALSRGKEQDILWQAQTPAAADLDGKTGYGASSQRQLKCTSYFRIRSESCFRQCSSMEQANNDRVVRVLDLYNNNNAALRPDTQVRTMTEYLSEGAVNASCGRH